MKYQGKPTKGIEFYNLLNQSQEFTSELGRVALASGQLEAGLILLLKRHNINEKYNKATLGRLIRFANKYNLITNNDKISFEMISRQRNYITHNIYALFIDLINETVLEKENLLDTDVILYIERVSQLKENLIGLAESIKNS